MGRTFSTVKNRYKSKAYDRVAIVVPKRRKRDAALIRADMGMTEPEWKARPADSHAHATKQEPD